jgi:Tetratricopeptide repeat
MKCKILAFVCCSLLGNAQKPKLDSLQMLLVMPTTADPTKVQVYDEMARRLMYSKPIEALTFAKQSLSLATQIKYDKGKARSYNRIGSILRLNGNFGRALEFHLLSLKECEKTNDLEGIARTYNNMGLLYSDQKDHKKAIAFYKKSKNFALQISHKGLTQLSDINIGLDFAYLNELDSALVYTKSAAFFEKKYTLGRSSLIFHSLADIFHKRKQYKEALFFHKSGMSLAQKEDDLLTVCSSLIGIAKSYKLLDEPDSSVFYLSKGVKLAENLNSLEYSIEAGTMLSDFYEKKDAKKALFYYKAAMLSKDKLINQENTKQIQNLEFNEQLRQQELKEESERKENERRHNLQVMAIAIFIVSFFLLVLLLSRKQTNANVVEVLGLVSLLMFFEFINLLVHPFLEEITHHSPILILILLMIIASILAPLHHYLTEMVKEKLAHKIDNKPHSKITRKKGGPVEKKQ